MCKNSNCNDIYVRYADSIYNPEVSKPQITLFQILKEVDIRYSDLFTRQSVSKPEMSTFKRLKIIDTRYSDFLYTDSLTKPDIATTTTQKPATVIFANNFLHLGCLHNLEQNLFSNSSNLQTTSNSISPHKET